MGLPRDEASDPHEQKMDCSAELLEGVFYSLDQATGAFHPSDQLLDMLGYRRDELSAVVGWWLEKIQPDDVSRVVARLRGEGEGAEPPCIAYHVRQGDGRFRHVVDRGIWIRDRSGRRLRLLASIQDITTLHPIEASSLASESHLQSAFEAAGLGFFLYDRASESLVLGGSGRRLLGIADDVPITRELLFQSIEPGDADRLRNSKELLCQGKFSLELRTSGEGENGPKHLLTQGRTWTDEDGYPRKIEGTLVDITPLQAAEDELTAQDRGRGEFLAVLAHELRNPLAPIRNALQLMEYRSGTDPAIAEELGLAERQVATLSRLIDDLRDVARIMSGRVELSMEPLDLQGAITHALEAETPLIQARGHRIEVTLSDESIRLEADPVRLEQILRNLLNNAAKYTEPGGLIWISARKVGGQAIVKVRDNGIGIDPAFLPKLFEMFPHGDRPRGRKKGGLGIGLSLVRSFVELHRGAIAARSLGPGQGSEFEVRLPLIESGAAVAAGSVSDPPDDPQEKLPRYRFLVVDDNVDGAVSLSRLLTKVCHQDVRVVHEGHVALQVADEFLPDIILLDIGLPGMDGFEVAAHLRENDRLQKTRIITLSGWGQDDDGGLSRALGIERHLVKPVELDTLRKLIAAGPYPSTS